MSPRDANEAGGAETAEQTERSAVALTDAALREQTTEHLQEAVSATDIAEKQFHVRQALQLLTVEDR